MPTVAAIDLMRLVLRVLNMREIPPGWTRAVHPVLDGQGVRCTLAFTAAAHSASISYIWDVHELQEPTPAEIIGATIDRMIHDLSQAASQPEWEE